MDFFEFEFDNKTLLGYLIIMRSVKHILLDKNHTVIQFFKYALSGGMAFAVDLVVFFLVAWLLFPSLTESDPLVKLFNMQVEPIAEHVRSVNFIIGSVIAFMASNMTAYVLNVLFVFKAGKHSRIKELALFYLVSGVSVGIGVAVGVLLIGGFGMTTTVSYIAKAVSTMLINYVARKFFIFHG